MLAGERLRILREKLGFTLRDVELASLRLVEAHENPKFWIPQSRLSDIENKGISPSIYRLHALSAIYRCSIMELMEWYGIKPTMSESLPTPPRTHLVDAPPGGENVAIPTKIDPLFNEKQTCYLRRMIQEWGIQSWTALQKLQTGEYTYGYVGSEDYTLYPLVLPGTFVQIDQSATEIESGPWNSDWERPIYFLETHDAYICGWCAVLSSREIQVQPHTLSGLAARNYKLPNEIEVVGQVVGMATRLRRINSNAEREPAMIRANN